MAKFARRTTSFQLNRTAKAQNGVTRLRPFWFKTLNEKPKTEVENG